MSTNLQDYIELLNAEQHVQVDKLRDHARHGISSRVRGEVWLYLLNVLSEDRTSEITSVFALSSYYSSLPSTVPTPIATLFLKTALAHHTHRFFNPTYASLISSLTAEQTPSASPAPFGPARDKLVSPAGGTSNVPRGSPPISGQRMPPPPSISSLMPPPTSTGGSPNMPASNRAAPPPLDMDTDGLTIRSQYMRFLPPPPSTPPSRQTYLSTVEEVLGKFWNAEKEAGRDDEWRREATKIEGTEKDWIPLVTPFVCCYTRPVAVFMGFQKLMERMRSFPSMPSRLASLLTLFRLAQPELFEYFEDEQVPYIQVAMSWVRTLLSKEMWLLDVLRLWDAYLAAEDMFELHCYVCVAVLSTCKETLEELDGSEAKLMLLDLPRMDVDRLLQDAANLKLSFPFPGPVDDA
ncbi:hypothetical protein EHS25_003266 [Saitozyma podzolica]|uniref:Rab-GAP TBC domain-containing protein n=1 Tax=Saitozyma podzolica TaxID=1890683 RepID=A0A427Y8J6_9TREE|nr:hypothetical protein EHS25_003266 [Saitozyma podzolica]